MANTNLWTRSRAKNLDKAYSGSTRAKSDRWQLVIERDIPNPEYVPKSDAVDENGNDTRTARQKRRTRKEQLTKVYEGEPITKAKADAAARAFMDDENGKLSKPAESGMTVADYVDTYLNGHEVENSTMTGYLSAAKHIRHEFANVLMSELTSDAVERWLSTMKKAGYSTQTAYRDYKVLHMVCRYAARRDVNVIEFDPTADIRKKPNPSETRENAENNCLALYASDGREATFDKHLRILASMEPTALVTAAYIATYAGLRCGEVCGLRWRDVDFENGIIRVRYAIGIKGRIGNDKGGCYLKEVKTKRSRREVPIDAVLADKLNERKQLMRHDLEAAGINMPAEKFDSLFVVGNIDGSFANPTTLSKKWTAHAEAFGLRGTTGEVVTFHGLRHTFASVLVMKGIDVRTVSDLMGHGNVAMTLNTYTSSNEQAKRNAITAAFSR